MFILIIFLSFAAQHVMGGDVNAKRYVRKVLTYDLCEGDSSFVLHGVVYTESTTITDTVKSFKCDTIKTYILTFHPSYLTTDTVRVCPGDTVYRKSRLLTEGDNLFTYKTVDGCDSIINYVLVYYPAYQNITDTTVTEEYFIWGDTTITTAGEYQRQYRSVNGCDSIEELRIDFNTPINETRYAEMCAGQIYNFNGRALRNAGTYVDSLKTLTGRDSIITLTLKVYHAIYDTVDVQTCGESYTFMGQTFTRSGKYDVSLKYDNDLACDSIVYRLNLTLCEKFENREVVEFSCDRPSFYWPVTGITYQPQTGTITKHFTTTCGCDSDYILELKMKETQVSITKCMGKAIILNGKTITQPGIYKDTLKGYCGLDSMVTYRVTDKQITHLYDTTAICDGDAYYFRGRALTVPGDYTDTVPEHGDCPDYYHLHLEVYDTSHFVETIRVCTDGAYKWHGKSIINSGHYVAAYKGIHGCDSIYEGDIVINRPSRVTENVEICQGETYHYKSRIFTKPGVYYDTLYNSEGCDSIVEIVLNVQPSHHIYSKDTVCESEYYFRGMRLTHSGTYYDSLKTATGCDSIYILDLVMTHPSHIVTYDTVCTNGTYEWQGRYLSSTGVYYDTLTNSFGCDSVLELHLYLFPTRHRQTHATICETETYWFNGKPCTETGTYYDTLQTINGCDSVIELSLNVQPVSITPIHHNICYGDSLLFKETYLTEAGTYYDTLNSVNGCDSIVKLELQVTPPYNVTDQHVLICEGDSFSFRGHTFTDGGIYYDTLLTTNGCDSVIKYVFTVGTATHDYKNDVICEGDYYNFFGHNLTNSGEYTHTERDPISGCETKISHLQLTVNRTYHSYEKDTICGDTLYYWHGKLITESGIYTDSFTTVESCDSVFELDITVFPVKIVELHEDVCHGQKYYYRGKLYGPGVYYDTLKTVHGCDSITKLTVNSLPEYMVNDTGYLCRGEGYTFRNQTLYHPGIYHDTLHAISGCDSVIELVLLMAPDVYNIEYDTVLCADAPYMWHGQSIQNSGTYRDSFTTEYGCLGIDELRLVYKPKYKESRSVALCPGQTYIYQGVDYSQPGVYVDTFLTEGGCDSIVTLVVVQDYEHVFYDSVKICQGDSYLFHGRRIASAGDYKYVTSTAVNGCDSIYNLHVEVLPTIHTLEYDTVCSNDYYLWRGEYIVTSGTYFDTTTTESGCDSIFELRLTKNPIITETISAKICDGQQFTYHGRIYTEEGIYYDTLTSSQGCDSILRLVVDVAPSYMHSGDTVKLCRGNSLIFQGKTVTKPGTYRDTLRTVDGCDSIIELVVEPGLSVHYIEYDTLCTSEPYFWHGLSITTRGVYMDTFMTEDGCEGIDELRLEYRPSYNLTVAHNLCPGMSYIYNGEDRSQGGVYVDSLKTVYGCDSVVTNIVTRNYLNEYYDTISICQGDYYDFHGRRIINAGNYIYVEKNASTGCDETYHLNVTVNPSFHSLETDTVCSNGYYHWRGMSLPVSGTYFDTIPFKETSCDSIFELRLTMYHIEDTILQETICDGDTFFLHGEKLTTQGLYYDTVLSSKGCDSVIKLVLNVKSRYTKTYDATICQGETYNFRGRNFGSPGRHTVTVPAPNGCDSTFILRLTVNSVIRSRIDTTICDGDVFFLKNRRETQPGILYDTVMTEEGCFNITEVHLNVKYKTYQYDTLYITKGGSCTFRGRTYTTQGVYTEVIKSVEDCDSMIYITRIEYIPYEKHIYADICDNYPLWLHDRMYDRTMKDTFIYNSGSETVADTLFFVDVAMSPHVETTIYDTVCNGGAYRFAHGQMLTLSGRYVDTLSSVNGCDSIITLYLEVMDSVIEYESATICATETYTWKGPNRVITQAGHYIDSVQNSLCKCQTYYELDLYVIQETMLQTTNGAVNDVTICMDEGGYTLWPTYVGGEPTEYSVTYDGVTVPHSNDVSGQYNGDSILMPIPTDQNHEKLSPGVYDVTLSLGSEYCDHSQYAVTFKLHIDYPSSIIRQRFGNVVSVLNSNYNGGYSFSGYKWYVNGNFVYNAVESNLYLLTLVPGDEVYAELRRVNETDYYPTCPITIHPYTDVQQYPTLDGTYFLPGRNAVLQSPEKGQYTLYDMKGTAIASGNIEDGETHISMPYVSGCYLLMVKTETFYETFKVIVR